MKIRQIMALTGATVVCGNGREDHEVQCAFASDLMSDVLAFCSPGSLLLTGLTNIQIVRTAQMLDLPAVVFVRGKIPLEETVNLAKESGIPVLLSKYSLYEVCGRLYAAGVKPSYVPQPREA